MTELGLGAPVQIAYAVDDVDAAARRWAATVGAGPFFVAEHIALTEARIDGRPAEFDHSSAYGQWGALMVELVQEHTPALVPPGRIHHVAFFVDSLTGATDRCRANGWPELLWARTAGGQEFAFCDARADLGHLVELYEPTPSLLDFYALVAGAAAGSACVAGERNGRFGRDPVRTARRR